MCNWKYFRLSPLQNLFDVKQIFSLAVFFLFFILVKITQN